MLIGLAHLVLVLSIRQRIVLPIEAKITVEQRYAPPQDSVDKGMCHSFHIDPKIVRNRFAHYHVLDGSEFHDFYLQFDCGVGGSIYLHGRKFFWIAEPGNLLKTDYPDGNVRWLGGRHTDDPAGGG